MWNRFKNKIKQYITKVKTKYLSYAYKYKMFKDKSKMCSLIQSMSITDINPYSTNKKITVIYPDIIRCNISLQAMLDLDMANDLYRHQYTGQFSIKTYNWFTDNGEIVEDYNSVWLVFLTRYKEVVETYFKYKDSNIPIAVTNSVRMRGYIYSIYYMLQALDTE